jgi:hypothetical protein
VATSEILKNIVKKYATSGEKPEGEIKNLETNYCNGAAEEKSQESE